MSTALSTTDTSLAKQLIQRFAWKEFRMLRGFWIAVALLTVIEQFVSAQLMFDARAIPNWMFASAWGAAALYAVGAAITLFSAEREELTRDYLIQLSSRWLPMFTGKMLIAALSTIALALVLSLTGYIIAGGNWPTTTAASQTLGVAGVAAVEALVWGLFFSLLMKQPLLAAILAMAAASFSAQIGVVSTVTSNQAFTVDAYSKAAPTRLLLCLIILLLDLRLASRWLNPLTGLTLSCPIAHSASQGLLKRITSIVKKRSPARRTILARLLWQTWRESWKTLFSAIPISLLLMLGIGAVATITNTTKLSLFLSPFLLPTLLGALIFREDQRPGHRDFLVTHAARPRYIWVARHVVGLATLILIGLFIHVCGWITVGYNYRDELYYTLRYYYTDHQSTWSTVQYYQELISTIWQITTLGWCALFAAYGIGQLCSMLLRREVLAGFLALLFAPILTAWTILVGLWDLSPVWFILPIGLVTMWATWLRAPDWILGRHYLTSWLKPLAAISLPMAYVLLTLPSARLAQLNQISLNETPITIHSPRTQEVRVIPSSYPFLQKPLDQTLREINASDIEARKTAAAYEQIYTSLSTQQKADPSIIEKIEKLSGKPCQFSAEVLLTGSKSWSQLNNLKEFLIVNAQQLQQSGDLQKAKQRYLSLFRLEGQILSKQSTNHVGLSRINHTNKRLTDAFLNWAQHPDQTSQNLKYAIKSLQRIYQNYPNPRDAIIADFQHIRDVIQEKELPASLQLSENPSRNNYLPYLSNKLPGERERALRALELLTTQRLNYVDAFIRCIDGGWFRQYNGRLKPLELSQLLNATQYHSHSWNILDETNEIVCDRNWDLSQKLRRVAAKSKTSYLVTDELSARTNLYNFLKASAEAEIGRRGLITQLALLAYRLDHESYPETLEELTPKYLPGEILDPYSQQPFEYRPEGLDLPLKYKLRAQKPTPAFTPLFWSVGITNNAPLQRTSENDEWRDQPAKEQDETDITHFYRFIPHGNFWGDDTNQVFTLPKP